jgi:YgiT-type zinc finger domain-containing protein
MSDKEKEIYGDCHYCGGEIEEQKISVDFWWDRKLFLIEDVPAGVCKQCGEKSFTAKVSKAMDEIIKSKSVERVLQIPVKRFSGVGVT